MRHRVRGYKLGRDTEHRTALFRNLVAGLFEHGQITTTLHKAKAVQPMAEKLITLAKRGDLHARRRAVAVLRDRIMCDNEDRIERNRYGDVVRGPKLIRHLFDEIGPRYSDRDGGYTRIIRLGENRIGDGGDLVILQLVGDEAGPEIGGLGSPRKQKALKRIAFAERALKGVASGSSDSGDADSATAVADAPEKEESADADDTKSEG